MTFFVGVSWLAVQMGARPSASVSVVAQIARATFPTGSTFGFMFWVVQVTTFAILVLAANTSFQGFPRLAALLARDRFFPRQFANLGDRLVYSNGIIVLSGLAILLLWHYKARVDSLIHLYVLGVFTAFTLSQVGMVRYWRRMRTAGWKRSAALNALGAATTGVVLVVVVATKFMQGAWLVTVAIPLLVLLFLGIHRHYRRTSRRLRAGAAAVTASATPRATTVVAVTAIDDATERAVWYAREVTGAGFHAVHVPGRGTDVAIRPRWLHWIGDDGPRLGAARVWRGEGRDPARVRLGRAAQRRRLRQRRRARAVQPAVPPRVPAPAGRTPTQAAPTQGARRRHHGRTPGGR